MLDHPPTRAGSPLSYRYRPSKGRRDARESRELGSVTSELVKQNTHSKAKTKTLPCIFNKLAVTLAAFTSHGEY